MIGSRVWFLSRGRMGCWFLGMGLPCISSQAWAQQAADPSATSEVKLEESSPAPTSEPSSPSPANQPPPVENRAPAAQKPAWQRAMVHYELGEPEKALEQLRALALACDSAETECPIQEKAAIYSCVGIVLAGGMGDHDGGVTAFKKALVVQPGTRLAPEYSTPPVLAAYEEAQGPQAAAASSIPLSDEAPVGEDEGDEHEGDGKETENAASQSELPHKQLMLLINGGAKSGFFAAGFEDSVGNVDSDSSPVIQAGGSAGFAVMPIQTSGFTVGGRMRGGALILTETLWPPQLRDYAGNDDETLAYLGGHVMAGWTFGPRVDSRFAYALGGFGFESNFEDGPAWFTGHLLGGVSVKGLLLGGGIDFGVRFRDDFVATYAVFGIDIGFGALL